MKSIICILVLLIGSIAPTWAHHSVTGKVVCADDAAPLVGATIKVLNRDYGATTDAQGRFSLDLIGQDSMVEVYYLGYAKKQVTINHHMDKVVIALDASVEEIAQVRIDAHAFDPLVQMAQVDLKTRPLASGQALMQLVPGVVIAQHAAGGKAEQIFVRGFDTDHGNVIALYHDGMPINMTSHAHGQGYADAHFVIPELIDRVEFTKGLYDASLGNLAIAGAIEMRTKNKLEHSMMEVELDQQGKLRTMGAWQITPEADKAGKPNVYVAGELTTANGPYDFSQNHFRSNLYAKYYHILSDDRVLNWSVGHFYSQWEGPGLIAPRAVADGSVSRFGRMDDINGGNTKRLYTNLHYVRQLSNGHLSNRLNLSSYDFDLYSNFTFFLEDSLQGDRIRQTESRLVTRYQLERMMEWNKENYGMKLHAGFEMRYDHIDDLSLLHVLDEQTSLDTIMLGLANEQDISAYAQWSLEKGNWNLILGARVQEFRQWYRDMHLDRPSFGDEALYVLPKAVARYQFDEAWRMNVKLGRSVASQDTRTAYLSGSNQAQVFDGGEVGVDYSNNKNFIGGVSLWSLLGSDELVYVGDGGFNENSGPTIRYGFDASFNYQIHSNWRAFANVNYALPRVRMAASDEHFVPLAPIISSNGGVVYHPIKGMQLALNYLFLGDRPANEDYSLTAEGYFLLEAAASYEWSSWRVALYALNLLNTEWKDAQFEVESRLAGEAAPQTEVHFTPGTPRNIGAKLSYIF